MSELNNLTTLLNARQLGILVETFEEKRFMQSLIELANHLGYKVYEWSITSGFSDAVLKSEQSKPIYAPGPLISNITSMVARNPKDQPQSIFVIKDFHDLWDNAQAKRAIRDYLESGHKIYGPLLFVSPFAQIPKELEKLISITQFNLPTREEMSDTLDGINALLASRNYEVAEGRERDAILNALVGMTESEADSVLSRSVVKNKKVSLDEIVAEKEQVIRKTGLLEYVTKLGKMEDVGGMDIFKDWLEDAKYSFDPEVQKLGIDTARGAVAVGVPGSGKSLIAQSVAHMWNLPLLKLNMSQIMDSKIGASEKNIDRALKLAEDVSPCVLWVDEIEKGLAGKTLSFC